MEEYYQEYIHTKTKNKFHKNQKQKGCIEAMQEGEFFMFILCLLCFINSSKENN
jgi:hypothetical protein